MTNRGTIGHRRNKRPLTETRDDSWKEQPVILPTVKGGASSTSPLIITGVFGHYRTPYMFLDPGSRADIMYEQCFNQLDDSDKRRLVPVTEPISGFIHESIMPRG